MLTQVMKSYTGIRYRTCIILRFNYVAAGSPPKPRLYSFWRRPSRGKKIEIVAAVKEKQDRVDFKHVMRNATSENAIALSNSPFFFRFSFGSKWKAKSLSLSAFCNKNFQLIRISAFCSRSYCISNYKICCPYPKKLQEQCFCAISSFDQTVITVTFARVAKFLRNFSSSSFPFNRVIENKTKLRL